MITVDGIEMGAARKRDRRGRVLPSWQGCRALAQGEVFLMNGTSRRPSTAVTSDHCRSVPLWTFGEE